MVQIANILVGKIEKEDMKEALEKKAEKYGVEFNYHDRGFEGDSFNPRLEFSFLDEKDRSEREKAAFLQIAH